MKQNCVSAFLDENGCRDFFRELNLALRAIEEGAKRSELGMEGGGEASGAVT